MTTVAASPAPGRQVKRKKKRDISEDTAPMYFKPFDDSDPIELVVHKDHERWGVGQYNVKDKVFEYTQPDELDALNMLNMESSQRNTFILPHYVTVFKQLANKRVTRTALHPAQELPKHMVFNAYENGSSSTYQQQYNEWMQQKEEEAEEEEEEEEEEVEEGETTIIDGAEPTTPFEFAAVGEDPTATTASEYYYEDANLPPEYEDQAQYDIAAASADPYATNGEDAGEPEYFVDEYGNYYDAEGNLVSVSSESSQTNYYDATAPEQEEYAPSDQMESYAAPIDDPIQNLDFVQPELATNARSMAASMRAPLNRYEDPYTQYDNVSPSTQPQFSATAMPSSAYAFASLPLTASNPNTLWTPPLASAFNPYAPSHAPANYATPSPPVPSAWHQGPAFELPQGITSAQDVQEYNRVAARSNTFANAHNLNITQHVQEKQRRELEYEQTLARARRHEQSRERPHTRSQPIDEASYAPTTRTRSSRHHLEQSNVSDPIDYERGHHHRTTGHNTPRATSNRASIVAEIPSSARARSAHADDDMYRHRDDRGHSTSRTRAQHRPSSLHTSAQSARSDTSNRTPRATTTRTSRSDRIEAAATSRTRTNNENSRAQADADAHAQTPWTPAGGERASRTAPTHYMTPDGNVLSAEEYAEFKQFRTTRQNKSDELKKRIEEVEELDYRMELLEEWTFYTELGYRSHARFTPELFDYEDLAILQAEVNRIKAQAMLTDDVAKLRNRVLVGVGVAQSLNKQIRNPLKLPESDNYFARLVDTHMHRNLPHLKRILLSRKIEQGIPRTPTLMDIAKDVGLDMACDVARERFGIDLADPIGSATFGVQRKPARAATSVVVQDVSPEASTPSPAASSYAPATTTSRTYTPSVAPAGATSSVNMSAGTTSMGGELTTSRATPNPMVQPATTVTTSVPSTTVGNNTATPIKRDIKAMMAKNRAAGQVVVA